MIHIFLQSLLIGYSGAIMPGALLSASNPYFLLWWAVVGLGLILSAYQAFGLIGIALFYFGHISADLSWYGSISCLLAKSKNLLSNKLYQGLIMILGILLIIFGAGFLINALKLWI